MSARRKPPESFGRRDGLGITVVVILVGWLLLYLRLDPRTHWGAFFGNATADWLGTLVIVMATKYFFEIGSAESRPPQPKSRSALTQFLVDHSLTIVLVATGALWIAAYVRLDADGKAEQVVGNIVSEWTQLLGLVVITKYLREAQSKESH
ncbi:MAG TPA: hypothetical protein VKD69_07570 [Vicinamibacterales bacterium]|nr:hypothetical protein [Vicinamibacterales bacterium]